MRNSEEMKRIESEETCLKKLASAFIDIALSLIESGDLEDIEEFEKKESIAMPPSKPIVSSNYNP